MSDSTVWSEIYTKTDCNPAWSEPGPDKNINSLVGDILMERQKVAFSVLDIGCGNGRNSLIFDNFSNLQIYYTGIDFSDAAIEHCQKSHAKENHTKEKKFFKQNISEPLDVSAIQAPSKGFDLIIDCGCFHSIPPDKRKTYIENLIKCAKENTTYIMGAWYKKDSNLEIITPPYLPYLQIEEWFFDETDIKKLFAPYFYLQSYKIDKSIYPDTNDGFAYFVLSRSDEQIGSVV